MTPRDMLSALAVIGLFTKHTAINISKSIFMYINFLLCISSFIIVTKNYVTYSFSSRLLLSSFLKFLLVITVVVYYGDNPWDGATTLHGMLNIPDKMKPFVNDYKMLLVEARQNNLLFHNMTNIAFFDMLKVVLDKSITKNEAKEKVIKYAIEHNVDKTVVMTVAGATNRKIDYNALSKKGDVTMCTLFDEIEKEGMIKGIQALIESLQEMEIPYNKTQNQLMVKFSLSEDTAQEYMDKFWK